MNKDSTGTGSQSKSEDYLFFRSNLKGIIGWSVLAGACAQIRKSNSFDEFQWTELFGSEEKIAEMFDNR